MPDKLVIDIPIVLDRDGKFELQNIADTVGMWEYQKPQRQLLLSHLFLDPYLRSIKRDRMLFSDIFGTDSRLNFQTFIRQVSANSFATCVAYFKTLTGIQKVLFCSISQDKDRIRGLCLLIPDSMNVHEVAPTQAPETGKYVAVGKMAGSIAHEINNPLSIIRMNAEILLASEGLLSNPEKIKEKCKKIITTTDRISSIVRALRTMSASAKTPQFSWVRFGDLVEDVLELCSLRLNTDAVDVTLKIQNISNEKFFIDHAQISQALINLFSNACDAIKPLPEKWIHLETDIRDEFLHIKVIDSGRGIPEDIFENISDEFFTTKGPQGLGLGLNLVQAYVSSHSGHLGYKLHDGHTCFYIALPLREVKPENHLEANTN